jgi:hypothetical protein
VAPLGSTVTFVLLANRIRHTKTCQATYRDLPGYVQRPARLRTEIPYAADVLDDLTGDREVDPENGTEVDGKLGQGQITF